MKINLAILFTGWISAASGGIISPFLYSVSDSCSTIFSPCDMSNSGISNPALSNISRSYIFPNFSNFGTTASMGLTEALWRGDAEVGGSINKFGPGVLAFSAHAKGTAFDNLTIPSGSYFVLPVHLTGIVSIDYSASSDLPADATISGGVSVGYGCQVNGFVKTLISQEAGAIHKLTLPVVKPWIS